MKCYLDQLRYIMENGTRKEDRTGVGTLSTFGMQARYAMDEGFPAVTTKQLVWKSLVSELLWFVSGSGDIQDLKGIYRHNKLWDGNYESFRQRTGQPESDGRMGRIYGVQWRAWEGADGKVVDQLQEAIHSIQTTPDSRRIIVNSWNAAEVGVEDVALPPCHSFFQFYVSGSRLSLLMYQRSCDMFLGVPLNIASYSLLLHMVARVTGLEPHEFIHTLADCHIYMNHLDAVEEQLSRKPYPLPKLHIRDRGQKTIDDFEYDDFELVDYRHHPRIRAEMAV
jgi:thymidylate synthase